MLVTQNLARDVYYYFSSFTALLQMLVVSAKRVFLLESSY